MRQDSAAPPVAIGDAAMTDLGRDSIAAATYSNAAFSAGLEAMGREIARSGRLAFESAGATARGLLDARTLEDVTRLQTDFANRSFTDFVEHAAKLSELGYSLWAASVAAWAQRAKAGSS
jgi:hypothetical protein